MAKSQTTFRDVSRRSFLKGSLATAALAGVGTSYLTGCAPSEQASEDLAETGEPTTPVDNDEIYSGVCRGNCYGGCFLNVHVRDGKVVRTSARDLPENNQKRICARGLSHVFRVYDPERVKAPMRRVGERGGGEWEQISWDEALDEVAEKFKGYAEQHGPESVAYWYGSGNDSCVNNIDRFMNHIGASKVFQQLDMAIFFASMKSVGVGLNFGGSEMNDLKNAKTIVVWGANPAVSQMQGMHFILEARDAGAKVIDIDPVFSTTASKCDQWVPIEPGTDGLLAMAIMSTIIDKGWQSVDFMKSTTVSPFLVKENGKYLRLSDLGRAEVGSEQDAIVVTDGTGTFGTPEEIADPVIEGTYSANGINATCAYSLLLERLAQYPVEEAVRKCGVPLETIEGLAADLTKNTPSTIYMCLGLDHYQNGFYSMFDIMCISALTGCAGTSGSFYGSSESLHYFIDSPENPYGIMSEGAIGTKYTVPTITMKEVMDSKSFLGNPLDIKALWICRANVLANMCDRQYTLSWLNEIEYIVATDMIMNETARYADLVLPICHWFEQEDIGATYPQNPFLEFQEKAIEPLYESRSDFDIVKDLAGRMGLGAIMDFTPGDYINGKFDCELGNAMGLTWEALKENKAMRGTPGSQEEPYIHGAGGVFPTATGRIQFYDENPAANTEYGQTYDLSNETLPYWEPPCEVYAGREVDPEKPYQILSDHQKLRTHSQWINVPAVRELDPEPTVRLHPDTAAECGLDEGDYGRIYNDRGHVVMKVHVSSGVRPGILLCSRGWDSTDFVDGHFQDVMQKNVHPVCVTQAFFDNVGNIEKVEA